MSKTVDLDLILTKIRDHLATGLELKEIIDEHLSKKVETLDHPETKKVETWDPEKIMWQEREGQKGAYELAEVQNSFDFALLSKDLAAHEGKLTKEGFFYWKFERSESIGRKPKGNWVRVNE